MKALHPDFSGEVFIEKLRLVAFLQFTDISGIEARHAAVRRQLTMRSVQTHVLDIADCSGEYLFQQLKTVRKSRHAFGRRPRVQRSRQVQLVSELVSRCSCLC
jgi:hypothetical protein